MSVYMTEDEQIEAIKKWWRTYQNHILLFISAILLILTGFRYWQWYQEKQSTLASTVYEQMMRAYVDNNQENIKAFAHVLETNHPKSVYASVAKMIEARLDVLEMQYDLAKNKLNDVIKSSTMPSLKQVARIRLARIELAQKQFQEAHLTLEIVNDSSWSAMIAELNGDIFQAQGKQDKAVKSYETAILESRLKGINNPVLEMKAITLGVNPDMMNQSTLAKHQSTTNV